MGEALQFAHSESCFLLEPTILLSDGNVMINDYFTNHSLVLQINLFFCDHETRSECNEYEEAFANVLEKIRINDIELNMKVLSGPWLYENKVRKFGFHWYKRWNGKVYLPIKYRQGTLAAYQSNKLERLYFGLFATLERIDSLAYILALLCSSKIHDVFHISLLKKALDLDEQIQHEFPADLTKFVDEHITLEGSDDTTLGQPSKCNRRSGKVQLLTMKGK